MPASGRSRPTGMPPNSPSLPATKTEVFKVEHGATGTLLKGLAKDHGAVHRLVTSAHEELTAEDREFNCVRMGVVLWQISSFSDSTTGATPRRFSSSVLPWKARSCSTWKTPRWP